MKIRSSVISDRIRDHNNRFIDCLNGNRHVYAEAGFLPVLPGVATIGDYKCRIYHATQSITFNRCHEEGHRALDINTCPAYIPKDDSVQVFWKHLDPLSNFYVCKVNIYDHVFSSSEHAYQYRKMIHIGNQKLADEVRHASNPRAAKRLAHRVPSDKLLNWHNIKDQVMKEILIAKLQSCADYVAALRDSSTKQLIEGSMDLYWGCGQIYHLAVTTHPHYLPGKNCLGIIHSEIRHFVQNGQNPPDIPISLYHRMMGRLPMKQKMTVPAPTPTKQPTVPLEAPLPTRVTPSVHQWMRRTPHLKQKTGLLVFHQMLPPTPINQTTLAPLLFQTEPPAPYPQMAPPQTVSLLRIVPQITVLIRKFLMISRTQPQMQAPVVLLR